MTSRVQVLAIVAALLACKASPSTAPSSSATSAPSAEPKTTTGALRELTPARIETRAKQAGYSVRSSDESKDSGTNVLQLQLESDDDFALVTLVDLGDDRKKTHAIETTSDRALVIHFEERAHVTAPQLETDILAITELAKLTRDGLGKAVKTLGWEVTHSSRESEDGFTVARLDADKKDDTVSILLYDLSEPTKERRAIVDERRFLNVLVCVDCTKQNEGLLTEASSRRKATKVLTKIVGR
jgi:hypothetical protein